MVHSHTHTQTPKHDDATTLWNQGVHTDREVTANWPDIIIKNKQEMAYILIDVAIPVNRNDMQKETEEKPRYKSIGIQ